MSPFHPTSFAGVQVALQAWRGRGGVGSLGPDWDAAWTSLAAVRCDAISATPTYLDLLLQNEPPGTAATDPRQITLGGEVLRPALGERLRRRFPATAFTAIYASAEFGVLLKTHRLDGWYETGALSHRGLEWRVRDGVLEVAAGGTWRATGDLVETNGALVRVVGRGDRVANVAGTKVNLDEVARRAEEAPGVRRAQAHAAPNPVAGQVVALRFACEPGSDPAVVRAGLESHLRLVLEKPAWPRIWQADELLPGRNAKRAL
jgi:acyl-CoA synthetase (AMP-forming)/AMP-acid ligase II